MDRIASASGSNKALIYRYFVSKDRLFDAAFDEIVLQTMNDVPIDGDDLPEYAGRLWDWYRAHPEFLRLADWDQLEREGAGMSGAAPRGAQAEKARSIAEAQRRGAVHAGIPAVTILAFIVAICRTPAMTAANHRDHVVAAVSPPGFSRSVVDAPRSHDHVRMEAQCVERHIDSWARLEAVGSTARLARRTTV